MLRVTSSRRAAGLKAGDYDHEITTFDNDSLGPEISEAPTVDRVSTNSKLLPTPSNSSSTAPNGSSSSPYQQTIGTDGGRSLERLPEEQADEERPHDVTRPSIEVQEPTPQVFHGDAPDVVPRKPQIQRQTAIDILYENERGGFLCGRALFSSQALGSLDAAPWTNVYHKPSPTSIHNAQVPDPSWEWAWSDWHINQQEGMDEDGWEYSFAFSSKFSWHGPRWYHSFVRRRAWTRKRIRKWPDDISADPHMLNTDYFNVRPASDRVRNSQSLSSRVPSRASMTQMSSVEVDGEKPDIEDLETLLDVLRFSRIDRERLEAMKNYLTNAMDLERLAEEMHEILSLFVFQASIRHLLSYLTQVLDETTAELDKTDTAHLRDRRDALRAAIKHADEEVRRLAYWSDVKQMAHRGASKGAVDGDKGWDEDWQGLDDSGPRQPNNGKLPRCESESGSDTPL